MNSRWRWNNGSSHIDSSTEYSGVFCPAFGDHWASMVGKRVRDENVCFLDLEARYGYATGWFSTAGRVNAFPVVRSQTSIAWLHL